jgi:uncharacterized LabA/DUF88 family protein
VKKPNANKDMKNTKPNFAFIDSQNLNLGVQKVGWKMDWRKLREYLAKEHNVAKAYMFIGYMPENEAMYEQLHDVGYLIVLKPTLELTAKKTDNKDEKPVVKGNIDAELVLYTMKEMPNYDKAIIVSGDGDFYCLAEYLANKKRLLHLMTPNWQYSTLLKPYEDYIVRLDKLRAKLEHKDFRKKFKKLPTKLDKNNHKSAY